MIQATAPQATKLPTPESQVPSTQSTCKNLRCKECGAEYELQPIHVCELCFGPLEVTYDYSALEREFPSRLELHQGEKAEAYHPEQQARERHSQRPHLFRRGSGDG